MRAMIARGSDRCNVMPSNIGMTMIIASRRGRITG